MVRNTKESALIIHRHGKLSEMPHALSEAELGFAIDENRLFIGNPNHVDVANREEFPYQNVEVLTEYSDILDIIKYRYTNNIKSVNGEYDREFYQEKLPLIIEGTSEPNFQSDIIFKLSNGEIISDDITINANSTISDVISKINNLTDILHITAVNNGNKLCLYGYGKEIIISGVNISNLNLPTSKVSGVLLPYRKLKEKLDDYISIKDYGYKGTLDNIDYYYHIDGDGTTDVGEPISVAIKGVFEKSDDAQFKRALFFPAGTYIIGTLKGSLPLINGMILVGEGIDRTIIKVPNTMTLTTLFDTYGSHSQDNIIIKDMTFDVTECNSLAEIFKLTNCNNVTFENVRFIGNNCNGISIYGSEANKLIMIDGCIFDGFDKSITSANSLKFMNITDSTFMNYNKNALYFYASNATDRISGCKIYSNIFTGGKSYNDIVMDGEDVDTVEYNRIVNNTFDRDILEELDGKQAIADGAFFENETNYTDLYGDNGNGNTIVHELKYRNIKNGVFELAKLPSYNKKIKLANIHINVINPFSNVYSYLNTACDYINGYQYMVGDVVKASNGSDTKYGIVIKDHIASGSIDDDANNNVLIVNSGLTDIKYGSIYAQIGNNEYLLLKNIDLQLRDDKDYPKKAFVPGSAYNGYVTYQDKLYMTNMNASESTVNNLHNTDLSTQIKTYGYDYHFVFDNRITLNDKIIDSSEVNFGGAKIIMKFFDANGNLVNDINRVNLNPSGKLVSSITYNKTELSLDSCKLTINTEPTDATIILTASGYKQKANTITVAEGTTVYYSVARPGFKTYTGSIVMLQNEVINIIYEELIVKDTYAAAYDNSMETYDTGDQIYINEGMALHNCMYTAYPCEDEYKNEFTIVGTILSKYTENNVTYFNFSVESEPEEYDLRLNVHENYDDLDYNNGHIKIFKINASEDDAVITTNTTLLNKLNVIDGSEYITYNLKVNPVVTDDEIALVIGGQEIKYSSLPILVKKGTYVYYRINKNGYKELYYVGHITDYTGQNVVLTAK